MRQMKTKHTETYLQQNQFPAAKLVSRGNFIAMNLFFVKKIK